MTLHQATFRISRYQWLGLIALLLIAFAMRFTRVSELPVQLHNDEMNCGLEARTFLVDRDRAILAGRGWYEHPNFGYWLPYLGLQLIDDSLFGLRMSSVIIGGLSILFIMLFVREWRGNQAAVLAGVYATFFHLHVHFSRTGFHYIHAALGIALTCWLTSRALRRTSRLWGFFAGGALGLSLQVYPATLLLLPLLPIGFAGYLCARRQEWKRLLVVGSFVGLGCALTLAPLIIHTIVYDGRFLARASGINVLSQVASTDANVWEVVLRQLREAFVVGMLVADESVQYGIVGGMIHPDFALILLISLMFALVRFRDPLAQLSAWMTLGTLVIGGALTVNPRFYPHFIPLAISLPILLALFTVKVSTTLRGAIRVAVVTLLLAGWIIWNGLTYLAYLDYAPQSSRDLIARIIERDTDARTLIDTTEQQLLRHESFMFMSSHVTRISAPLAALYQTTSSEWLARQSIDTQSPIFVVVNPEHEKQLKAWFEADGFEVATPAVRVIEDRLLKFAKRPSTH